MTRPLRLAECCLKIGSGATPRGGKDVYLSSGPYSLIRSQNVHNDAFYRTGLAYISEEQARELRNAEVLEGDVLLNITGDSVARACQVDVDVLPARVNQHVAIIRPDPSKIDPRFLRYFLVSPSFQEFMLGLASAGATRNALTKGMIEAFELPPLCINAQRQIGSTLGALDDKIELNRRMNETLEALAQAIFRDWFVDFGPVRRKMDGETDPIGIMGGLTPDPARAAELAALFSAELSEGGLPTGWLAGTLGSIASTAGEGIRPDQIRSDTPYIGLEHMPRRSIALSDWEGVGKVTSQKARFSHGQVLFGKLRPYFHKVGVAPVDGVCSTDIVVLDSKQEFDRALLLCCASSDEFVAFNDQSSTGTKMPRTSWAIMRDYGLAIAPERVRRGFSNVAQPLIERVLANISESRTLAETRDYLLPRLMSGQIRADDATPEIQAAVA